MQYIIFDKKSQTYWDGQEFVEDKMEAKYYNARADAMEEVEELEIDDPLSFYVIVGVE
jgi:hypothetical protein